MRAAFLLLIVLCPAVLLGCRQLTDIETAALVFVIVAWIIFYIYCDSSNKSRQKQGDGPDDDEPPPGGPTLPAT